MKKNIILTIAATLLVAGTVGYCLIKDNCEAENCKTSSKLDVVHAASCNKCGKETCDKSCATNLEGQTDKTFPSCSLDATAQIKRGNEVISKIWSKATSINELADGYDLVFTHSPEMVAELTEIAAFERKCCASFTWEVSENAAQKQIHLKVFGSEAIKKELKSGFERLGLAAVKGK